MARKYEDFDEEDQGGVFDQVFGIISNRKREFAIVSVVAAMVLLGVVVFGSYPESEESAGESVPIVRADAGEYKVLPDNPGGMEIPYRDSTVFSSADGQKPEDGAMTENILADEGTEAPLPKEQLFAGLNTQTDEPGGAPVAAPTTETPSDDPALTNQPKGEVEETMAKVDAVEPPSDDSLIKEAIGVPPSEMEMAMETPEDTKAAPEKEKPVVITEEDHVKKAVAPTTPRDRDDVVAKTEPAAGATTAAKAVTPGGFYVQLASVKSLTGATAEYKKLQAKFPGLAGLKYRTQEANLGAKGTFYRIQAGPMSKEDATRICMGIKAKGGSCLVAAK